LGKKRENEGKKRGEEKRTGIGRREGVGEWSRRRPLAWV
jgi:hypothetical protein